MAMKMGSLTTADDWNEFLTEAGVPASEAAKYANTFMENRIVYPADLTRDILKELGITKYHW